MSDLFSSSSVSFSHPGHDDDHHQPPPSATFGPSPHDLDPVFVDVDSIKKSLEHLVALRRSLPSSNEKSNMAHDSKAVKELCALMDDNVTKALTVAMVLKVRIQMSNWPNEAYSREAGHGVGSASERRKKLRERMQEFNELREMIREEYRETVRRRYFTVTGEMPDDGTLDSMISTGQSETFLQKAIQQQGRGKGMDAVVEIQARNDAIKDLERNLKSLHKVFKDIVVLVESRVQDLDDIVSQVNRAHTNVRGGNESLQSARSNQKNTRKWIFMATVLFLVVVLLIVCCWSLNLRPNYA